MTRTGRPPAVAANATRATRIAVVIALLVAGFVTGLPTNAMAEISVTVSVRQTTVTLNESFPLTVSVEGTRSAPAPDLGSVEEHFTVRSAGSSTNISMVNGRITQSKSFTYMLLPRELGTFTVGPARVEVDGSVYLSNTFDVTVVEGGTPAPQNRSEVREGTQTSSGRDVFATTAVDKASAYVDEQITLSFKYYRRSEPFRQPQYEAPDLTGFWVEDLDAREEYIEIVEGRQYRVTELKTALFGTASGQATVGPATLVYYEEGPMFTFFSRAGERQTLTTDPIDIEIKAPPDEGRPAAFTGAVGRFQLSSSIDVTSVAVGDPVTLTVSVRGTGNIRTVPTPDLSGLTEFRVYESGSSTEVTRKNGVVGGVKRYEFVLVPLTEGEKTLPAVELVFFDPSTGRYEATGSAARTVRVVPGTGEAGDGTVARAAIERVGGDIRYIRESTGPLRPAGLPLHARPWFLLLQLVPPLALVLVVVRRRRADRLGSDVRLARYHEASARSRDALKAATESFAAGSAEQGCSAVARAVTGFIGDRIGAEARGMTIDELAATLRSAGADEDLVSDMRRLLGVCDAARFAGASGGVESERLVSDARECIRSVEQLTRKRTPGSARVKRAGSVLVIVAALAACAAVPACCRAQVLPGGEPAGAAARFREANELYAAERYGEAAALYEAIIEAGFSAADVQYNLGNARYKLGESGRAVLAYERALRIEPGHDDARANLEFVRERLADRQAPLEDGPLTALLRGLLATAGISMLEAVASGLLFCLFGVIIVGVIRRRVVGWPLRTAVALLVAFALVTTVVAVKVHEAVSANDAVVLAAELAARTGPGTEFVLEFQLHEGTTVAIQEVRGEWARVTLRGTDLVGWVRHDGLENI